MKKISLIMILLTSLMANHLMAQDLHQKDVPKKVTDALVKKFPNAKKLSWEMEKGNYEANWGGKSGEDTSVVFTPAAIFMEMVVSMPINQLPSNVAPFIQKKYNKASIREAGRLTDAAGKQFFEVEIKGKDLIFDEKGNFIKED